jgi:DNA-binding CsgD family transcriptional regulator
LGESSLDHVLGGIGEFSSAIGDLLDAAATTSLDEFPEALLRVLHRRLEFDGAVVGHADPLSDGPFSIAVAHVHQREPSILDEYKLVSENDPVTQSFLAGLLQPLAVDTEVRYQGSAHAPVLAFSRRHRLRHLLLCGYPPHDQHRGRWIVLYRAHDRPFEADSIRWFGAFCLHLDRALDINRSRALSNRANQLRRKAMALIDGVGRVELADATFPMLVAAEFRSASAHRLPTALVLAMKQSHAFKGRCITGKFTSMGSHHVCELREVGPVGLLTPREAQVAQLFAQGSNSREIAAALSVSMSTVHSHIASAYRKLGISDKGSLVRIFADGEA